MQEPTNQPIPSPSGKQCFNCGKDLEKTATFCPHCGAPLPTQGSGFAIVFRFIALLVLASTALLLGAAGACFMLFGSSEGSLTDASGGLGFGAIGLLLFGGAALCLWGAAALMKKR